MLYDMKCSNEDCTFEKEVEASIQNGPPKDLFCEKCNSKMRKIYGTTIIIPEYMKAATGGDDFTNLKNRMAKSRPSGRDKVLY